MTDPPADDVEPTEMIRTLHVDDDTAFAEVAAAFLEESEQQLEVVTESTVAAGLERTRTDEIDCVVSDYDMPGQTGLDFLEQIRETDPSLPFILFTGKGSEEVASEAVSKGVTDYLQKEHGTDQYTVLANRIVNLAQKARAEVDLEQRQRQDEAVATLGQTALATDSLEPLFAKATRLVAERLGADYTKVLQLRPDHGDLLVVSGVGWDEGIVGTATVPVEERSQAGYTLERAEPVVVTDLSAETRFSGPDLLTDHDVTSGVSVIIGSPEDPWGVFGVHTVDRRRFTEHDAAFIQNVANVLASAIDQHRAKAELRESEERFREIAELSPDGIFRTNTDGVFTYVSPASEELLKRGAETLIESRFSEVVAPESKAAATDGIERVMDGEVVRGLALTLVDGDGERVEVEVSASPVQRDGAVRFVQGFARDVTDRLERERALQQSRERFQALVDLFPNGGVFLFDEDLRYTMVGGDELAGVGLTSETMVGKTPSDIFPPENASILETAYQAALDGNPQSFEDGWQNRHYHVQTVPLRNADGDIISGMAVAQNITDRVEREEELRASQERYRTLVDNFPGAVVGFDPDLRITAAGGLEFERIGIDIDEFATESLDTVIPSEQWESVEPHIRATLDGERRSFEYDQEGEQYHVQTMPLRDADGEVQSGMVVAQNVTERAEYDRKLDQLRERTQALMHTQTVEATVQVAVDAATDVIGATLSGVHLLNDAGDRLEASVMADEVDAVFDEPPEYDRDAEPGSRDAVAWDVFESGESVYIADTQTYEPLEEDSPSGSVVLYPLGRHGLFVVAASEPNAYDETDRALTDILGTSLTAALDRVTREQRLRTRETRLEDQNERLSRFARIVSHDLRNPLSVAEGRLHLARVDAENRDDHLDAVSEAHQRMDDLIEGLLELTLNEGETDPAEVSLAAVAEASWGAVETMDGRLVVDSDRTVVADEGRLRQLLENLFRNSVEHSSTADDSSVTVTVGDLAERDGFFVADDGPGIPADLREKAFEAGYSTTDAGIGFGLSIVMEIATDHGWDVAITDAEGGGARFEFVVASA